MMPFQLMRALVIHHLRVRIMTMIKADVRGSDGGTVAHAAAAAAAAAAVEGAVVEGAVAPAAPAHAVEVVAVLILRSKEQKLVVW